MAGGVPAWWRAAVRTLRPSRQRWAVEPGLRAVAAASVVLAVALVLGDPVAAGIAYFGVACAAVFVGSGDYRTRAVLVAAQAAGATSGMVVGAVVPADDVSVLVAAVLVGGLAGAVGRIGPAATAFAMMAVIGVAYTQFGRLPMPWWEPPVYYLAGSALLLVLSVAGVLVHPERPRRAAVAAVFSAAAEVARATDPSAVQESRHRLALASAAAQQAMTGYSLGLSTPRGRPTALDGSWSAAREAAARAAALSTGAIPADPDLTAQLPDEWQAAARTVRGGGVVAGSDAPSAPVPSPGRRLAGAAAVATGRTSLLAGARLAACVGTATGLALLLHSPQHAYWLPLTVATVVRPEYAPVLVRVLHRLIGTLAGVVVVAVVVAVAPSSAAIAACAALALGLAVLAGPRLYGLAVVGITGSALLSIAVGTPDDLQPWARLADTVLGCAIAVVVGVLLWPRRGLPDHQELYRAAVGAVGRQITSELGSEPGSSEARGEAYRLAHAWRAQLERDVAEPDPTDAASRWLPVALQLERLVDVVSATSDRLRLRREADRGALAVALGTVGADLQAEPADAAGALAALTRSTGAVVGLGRSSPTEPIRRTDGAAG